MMIGHEPAENPFNVIVPSCDLGDDILDLEGDGGFLNTGVLKMFLKLLVVLVGVLGLVAVAAVQRVARAGEGVDVVGEADGRDGELPVVDGVRLVDWRLLKKLE